MKIAIIVYYSPGVDRIYIVSLCNMLKNMGHELRVFNYLNKDKDTYYAVTKNDRVKVKDKNKVYIFIKEILHKYFSQIFNILLEYKRSKELRKELRQIRHKLTNDNFDFSIGIEKGGIIVAHELYKLFKVPFYYFSLELYDEGNYELKKPSRFKVMRPMEIEALRNALGIIIADEDRKNSLYETGNIDPSKPVFYLPISFDENIIKDFIFSKPSVSDHKIILNFGHNRLPDDFFVALIKKLPQEYLFLMHHFVTDYHEELAQNNLLKNIQFSNKPMVDNEITTMINNSFVGLSWYESEPTNECLTAFSSEKTARYLAAGKPIIANAKTNFPKLFSSIKCGIAVNSPDEFIEALQTISLSYNEFCENARKAFDQIYKLSNYENPLNMFLLNNL